jgi:hypothetical protein
MIGGKDHDQLPDMSKVIFSRQTSRPAHPSRNSSAKIVEEGRAAAGMGTRLGLARPGGADEALHGLGVRQDRERDEAPEGLERNC